MFLLIDSIVLNIWFCIFDKTLFMDNWVSIFSKSSTKGSNKGNTANDAKSKSPSQKTTSKIPKEDRKALIWFALILLILNILFVTSDGPFALIMLLLVFIIFLL